MKPLTREWVEKAEGDFIVATTLLRPRRHPVYDSVCFHAQQAIEKYMKAVLLEGGIAFERTHVLPALLDQLLVINPMWDAFREGAKLLSNYGVRFRYPGSSADRVMAREAVARGEVHPGYALCALGNCRTAQSSEAARHYAARRQ